MNETKPKTETVKNEPRQVYSDLDSTRPQKFPVYSDLDRDMDADRKVIWLISFAIIEETGRTKFDQMVSSIDPCDWLIWALTVNWKDFPGRITMLGSWLITDWNAEKLKKISYQATTEPKKV